MVRKAFEPVVRRIEMWLIMDCFRLWRHREVPHMTIGQAKDENPLRSGRTLDLLDYGV